MVFSNSNRFLLFLIAFLSGFTNLVRAQMDGSWIATVQFDAYPDLIRLEFGSDQKLYTKIYYANIPFQEVKQVRYTANQLVFSIETPDRTFDFNLTFEGDTLKGNLRIADQIYPIVFLKVIQNSLEHLQNLVGFYQFGQSEIIEVDLLATDDFVFNLVFLNFKTGQKQIAFALNDTTFMVGKKMLQIYPIQTIIKFRKQTDSDYKLEWGGRWSTKKLKPLSQESLTFTVFPDSLRLYGDLSYADTNRRYPLLVFVPDAGVQGRNNILDDYIHFLPYTGIATLIYDKRGCFQSEGNYKNTDLFTLADDVITIIKTLKKHPRIDSSQIILFGLGQGTVINNLISRKLKVQAMINIGTVTRSLQEQDLEIIRSYMTLEGYKTKSVRRAIRHQKNAFKFIAGKLKRSKFEQCSNFIRDSAWTKYLILSHNKESIKWWQKHKDLNLSDRWQTLDIPILNLYGSADLTLNVAKSQKFKTVHIFKDYDHFLLLGKRRGALQYTEVLGYPPDLFNLIQTWLEGKLSLKGR